MEGIHFVGSVAVSTRRDVVPERKERGLEVYGCSAILAIYNDISNHSIRSLTL